MTAAASPDQPKRVRAPRKPRQKPVGERKPTPANITALKRQAEACDLREKRHTFDQIAEIMGFSDRGEAWRAVKAGMDAIIREPAEAVRTQEVGQLDWMARLLFKRLEAVERFVDMVLSGDASNDAQMPDVDVEKTIQTLLKIQERRARLLGLDAPTQTNITGEPFAIAINPDLLPAGTNLGAVVTPDDNTGE